MITAIDDMNIISVDLELLAKTVHYDPDTGIFTRLNIKGGKSIGSKCG